VIRPGARAALAASRGGPVAVLGTPGTVRSRAYEYAIHEIDPERDVHAIACPLFVPLAEEGWTDHAATTLIAREYLAPLAGTGVDTIILGCTHYPLLQRTIRAVADEVLGTHVALVDSATAVASEVARFLDATNGRKPASPATHRFFVTDAPERTGEVAARFWPAARGVEHVDIKIL
jgi:glutamate racemase